MDHLSLLSRFLSLRCAGDVINAVTPVTNMAKEITESMAIAMAIRPWALASPMRYSVLDLCAGNGLTGILIAHLLPVQSVLAIDRKPRKRRGYSEVQRWAYIEGDVYTMRPHEIGTDKIIVSSHPCGDLARRVCELYADSAAEGLAVLPCCIGSYNGVGLTNLEREKLGKYEQWALTLARMVGGNAKRIHGCLSPRNILITAHERGALG